MTAEPHQEHAQVTARIDWPWNQKYLQAMSDAMKQKQKKIHGVPINPPPEQFIVLHGNRLLRHEPATHGTPIPIPHVFYNPHLIKMKSTYPHSTECGYELSDTMDACNTECVDPTETNKETACSQYWRVPAQLHGQPCDIAGGSNNGQFFQCAPPIFHEGAVYSAASFQINYCRPTIRASDMICILNQECTPFNVQSDIEIRAAINQCPSKTNGKFTGSEPLMIMGPHHNEEALLLPYQLCIKETHGTPSNPDIKYEQGWNIICSSQAFERQRGFTELPELQHVHQHHATLQVYEPREAFQSQGLQLRMSQTHEEYPECKQNEEYKEAGVVCIAECNVLICRNYGFMTVTSGPALNKPCMNGRKHEYPELCSSVVRGAMDVNAARFVDGNYWIDDYWNNERVNYYQHNLEIYELITISMIIGVLLVLFICLICWLMWIYIIFKWVGSKREQMELERVEI